MDIAAVDTPYGPIQRSFAITNGITERQVYYAHPMALVHQCCKVSQPFASFLLSCLRGGTQGSIVLYIDMTTPGNNLRPEVARSYYGCYWTLLEFPSWYRAQDALGWIPFACIMATDLKASGTSIAALMKHIIRIFFSPDDGNWNFSNPGIRVPYAGAMRHISFNFAGFLGDVASHAEVLGLKGASGLKPCPCCMDVVGRCERPLVHGYFKCVKDIKAKQCKPHTNSTFKAMLDFLDTTARSGDDVGQLEKRLGLRYDPDGLVYDLGLRAVVRVPECIIWDFQHCLLSSGGIAQYHINQFLLKLYKVMPAELVASFCNSITLPRSWPRLPKSWFITRVVKGEKSHLRGFSSEVMTAAYLLSLLAHFVLLPTGRLLADAQAIFKLTLVLDFASLGDGVVERIQDFDNAIDDYCDSFLGLYYQCSKPKLHYMSHIADNIRRNRAFLSCFAPERRHHFTKQLASFMYNALGKSLSSRSIYHFVEACKEAHSFCVPRLNHSKQLPLSEIPASLIQMQVVEAFEGRSVTLAIGTVHKLDMVIYDLRDGPRVGSVLLPLKVVTSEHIWHAVVIRRHHCDFVSGLCTPLDSYDCVKADMIQKTLIHCLQASGLHVRLPLVH